MAARNHINPNQLKMFMTPREIDPTGSVDNDDSLDRSLSERSRRNYLEGLLDRKKAIADKIGLSDSILEEGVKTPIQVIHDPKGGNILGHGNHRFAVARQMPDTLIPVIHTEGPRSSTTGELDPWEAIDDYREYMANTGHGDTGTGDSWSWHGKPQPVGIDVNWAWRDLVGEGKGGTPKSGTPTRTRTYG